MLVVTRRPGESIVIELRTGEMIELVVLSVASNQVKLGTAAPKCLPVVRSELLEQLGGWKRRRRAEKARKKTAVISGRDRRTSTRRG
jgi:carbon storage regulator CsrA